MQSGELPGNSGAGRHFSLKNPLCGGHRYSILADCLNYIILFRSILQNFAGIVLLEMCGVQNQGDAMFEELNQFNYIDFRAVHDEYDRRLAIGREMNRLLEKRDARGFAGLALGIRDGAANYAASTHQLGPKILRAGRESRVVDLAGRLKDAENAEAVLLAIRSAGIPWLKIGVGSEMAMMLSPERHWAVNIRTVCWHQLTIDGDNWKSLADQKELYARGLESEIDYSLWESLFPELRGSLRRLYKLGSMAARRTGPDPGDKTYLWADALASRMFLM